MQYPTKHGQNKIFAQSSKMISPRIDAPADSDIMPAPRRKTLVRKRTMTSQQKMLIEALKSGSTIHSCENGIIIRGQIGTEKRLGKVALNNMYALCIAGKVDHEFSVTSMSVEFVLIPEFVPASSRIVNPCEVALLDRILDAI
jgi:hypothetical protein